MKNFEKRTVPMVMLFVLALFFAGAGAFLSFYNGNAQPKAVASATEKKKLNPADLHIAQYSDSHITINAIDSDGRFNGLALADYVEEDRKSAGLSSPFSQMAGAGLALLPQTTVKEYGTWIWTPIMEMTPEYMDSIVKGAKENGINTIYVSLDSYLDIYALPNGDAKEKKRKAFADTLESFVALANSAGIAVDAEAGWRNWAEDGNTYKAFAVINFAKEFNRTQKYTLRGFQYDVEPYLLDSYKTEPVPVLKNFLALIDESITLLGPRNNSRDLQFSVVVPDFYDVSQSPVPPFQYGVETSAPYNHLLDVLERRPGSSVIIMSYRNFALGSDGSIDISNTEVQTATNGLYSTKVIVAEETGDVLPPYITFNNTSKKYYSEQTDRIREAFEPYANFGGIAVHYINAFLTLK